VTEVLNIALSGMQAAGSMMNTAANNIANLNTPGYRASHVDLVELSGGGVAVGGGRPDTAPAPVSADGKAGSNVDLATEMVSLIQSRNLYSANAMVVKTADRMVGSLLDMFDTDRGRGN
jgi:flagellar hook protein FlgE